MKSIVPSLIGSAVGGIAAALLVLVVSKLTSGTVSPLAAGLIGMVFGITVGNFFGRSPRPSTQMLLTVLRAAVAGLAAAATVFLIQGA